MVRFVRTARIAGFQIQAAMGFAHEISEVVKSKFGVEVKVYMQVGGPVGRICWEANYEDLGAYQKLMGQVLSDPDYMKKVADAQGLFIEGSSKDSLWVQM